MAAILTSALLSSGVLAVGRAEAITRPLSHRQLEDELERVCDTAADRFAGIEQLAESTRASDLKRYFELLAQVLSVFDSGVGALRATVPADAVLLTDLRKIVADERALVRRLLPLATVKRLAQLRSASRTGYATINKRYEAIQDRIVLSALAECDFLPPPTVDPPGSAASADPGTPRDLTSFFVPLPPMSYQLPTSSDREAFADQVREGNGVLLATDARTLIAGGLPFGLVTVQQYRSGALDASGQDAFLVGALGGRSPLRLDPVGAIEDLFLGTIANEKSEPNDAVVAFVGDYVMIMVSFVRTNESRAQLVDLARRFTLSLPASISGSSPLAST